MLIKRKMFLQAVSKVTTTFLNAGGSALVSMYDSGVVLINRTRIFVKTFDESERSRKTLESKIKISALKYQIGKEIVRLKWYDLCRCIHKH